MQVIKRDGTTESYDSEKIRRAILMAADSVDEVIVAKEIVGGVIDSLVGKEKVDVDELSKIVETYLCMYNAKVARAYIEYRSERSILRKVRLKPSNRWLQEYIDITKYCRDKESWTEAVERVRNMHLSFYEDRGSELLDLIYWSFDLVKNKQVLPSMRSMQFGGEAILKNHNRMYNCRALCMDHCRSFQELFYLLLCGCGVGYSVQWIHINMLPRVKQVGRNVQHWTIEDTIEGWADALGVLVNSYFESRKYVEFDYSNIRPEGSLLYTSGGLAPGHLGLKEGLENIRDILDRAQGRQLRPIEVSDINCWSARAVVSGGIRRASLIGLFSASDGEMMYSKFPGAFTPGGLNSHRDMANISCVVDSKETFDKCLELSTIGYGEPGYYFTSDPSLLCNPCGEITMDCSNGEIGDCNLSTINAHYWSDEVIKAATIIGTLQAGYKDYKYIGRQMNSERDSLIGVGICGVADMPEIGRSDYQRGAKIVLEWNERVAKMIGIPKAARCCDIAPNGTSSLSLGCIGAGVHPQPGRRYLRRVTANAQEAGFQHFRSYNPHMCIEKENGDWVIEFPVEAKSDAVIDLKGIDHLKMIQRIYQDWVVTGSRTGSHNVSASIMIHKIEDISEAIWEKKVPNASTFIPADLSSRYPYSPQEVIVTRAQEARWNEIIENYKEVNWKKRITGVTDYGSACEGSKCII